MKILSFGEIIWDVYPTHRVIGGAPLNFAGHCVRGGAETYLLSAVGRDELGEEALRAIEAVGVRSELISFSDRPTGQCLVTLNEKGVPQYNVLTDVAYDNISNDRLAAFGELKFDALCFGTLAQRRPASRATLEKLLAMGSFGEVFCDLNLRNDCYDEGSIKNCLDHATVLKFSDEEAPRLSEFAVWQAVEGSEIGETVQKLFAAYPRLKYVLYTKGGDGATVFAKGAAPVDVPAVGDRVVSTVGAGDSFGSTWLCRYLSGDSPADAARVASRVSGFVVSVTEALPEYRIEDFL